MIFDGFVPSESSGKMFFFRELGGVEVLIFETVIVSRLFSQVILLCQRVDHLFQRARSVDYARKACC